MIHASKENMFISAQDCAETSLCKQEDVFLRANIVMPAGESRATSSSSASASCLPEDLKKVKPANPSMNSSMSLSFSGETIEDKDPCVYSCKSSKAKKLRGEISRREGLREVSPHASKRTVDFLLLFLPLKEP